MPGDFEQGLAEKEHYPGIFLRPELPVDGQALMVGNLVAEAAVRVRCRTGHYVTPEVG